jgi:hypothetical protein
MVKVLAGKRNQEDLTGTVDRQCEWATLMKCNEVIERSGVRRERFWSVSKYWEEVVKCSEVCR